MAETVRFKLPVGNQTIDTIDTSIETPEQIAEKKRIADEAIESAKLAAEKEIADKLAAEKLEADKNKISTTTILNEGQVVELDGIDLTINKDGDAVDNTGKVIKTSIELADLLKTNTQTQDQTSTNYIKEIQSKTNLIINDEAGSPVTYENTVEGISKYAEDVFTTGKKTGAVEYEQSLLSEFPIIKDVINHLKLNGTLDGFTNKIDFSKISISESDEDQWLGIYIAAQEKRGVPEEEARVTAKYFKEDGKLKEYAQKSLSYLNAIQQQEELEINQMLQQQQQEEIENDRTYWNEVKKVVLQEGKIKLGSEEFVIPKVMRVTENGKTVTKSPSDFWNYVNVPKRYNIDGELLTMTPHQYDIFLENQKRNVNDDVYEALNRFLKQDKSQLIKAQVSTATAKQIIKLSTKTNTVGTGNHDGGSKKLVLPVPSSNK